MNPQYRIVYVPENPEHQSWSDGKTPEEISARLRGLCGPRTNHYEDHAIRKMPINIRWEKRS